MEMIKVYVPNVKGKALVRSNNTGKFYIVPARGFFKDQEIKLELDSDMLVPSFLYGIAMLYEKEDWKEGIEFIKNNF